LTIQVIEIAVPWHNSRAQHALGNKGNDTRALQAYLGRRNIQHTVRYTELSPTQFKDFWKK
jgi:site-specific recombinase XerD